MLRRIYRFLLVALLSIPLSSQTAQSPETPKPLFKTKSQLVLLDVVVTDSNGFPILGLKKDDFEVSEGTGLGAGDEQAIQSFEEHHGESTKTEPPPPLPPNVYTNIPTTPVSDSINVLLLDALNTHFEDQVAVRRQMIEYLKKIKPGPRLAIFTLGSQLQMVEGFNSDPRPLIEALNHKDWGGKARAQTDVRTSAEAAGQQTMVEMMQSPYADYSQAAQDLIRFLNEVGTTEKISRISVTLDALSQLSQYLSGYPGRKNLIWFSGSFPAILFPSKVDFSYDSGIGGEFKETINLLAGSQIAVYPVGAQGLEPDAMFQANQLAPISSDPSGASPGGMSGSGAAPAPPAKPLGQRMIEGMNERITEDSNTRDINNMTAEELAHNTGGRSFYNSNGLKDSLDEAVKNGSHYYTLSYSPTDKQMLGRYRHIQVKLRHGHFTLAYRRGYFEEGRKDMEKLESASLAPATDTLHRLLRRGLPDSTQILFNLRVLRTTEQPVAVTSVAGDNERLHDPVTRYTADFLVPIENFEFETTPDGVRHGNVELALVAYDHSGNPLNWMFRSIKTSLKPEVYPAVLKSGATFHEEIDIPAGENYLKAGIYDVRSRKSGTMEIALARVGLAEKPAPKGVVLRRGSKEDRSTDATSGELPETLTATSGSTLHATDSTSATVAAESTSRAGSSAYSGPIGEIPADVPGYCTQLTGTIPNAATLAKLCEFVLSMPRKLPDVVCQQKTKRYWKTHASQLFLQAADFSRDSQSDMVTAQVTYRDGHENFDDVQIDGRPVDAKDIYRSGGTWSIGEFALSLDTIFLSPSAPAFRYLKEEKAHSVAALVFDFHILGQNNKYYYLNSGNKVWFPAYHGKLWIDKTNSRLLKFERETADMPDEPITHTKTSTEYSNVSLGDGTEMVLPVHSEVSVCGRVSGCARNIVTFTGWQKFRAKTKIILNPN